MEPDTKTFPLLGCAIDSIGKGGALPAVLNAANEIAVSEFLKGRISFLAIGEAVCETVRLMENASSIHDLEGIIAADRQARQTVSELLNRR